MAGTDGQAPHPLVKELAENPFAFDFFRAVRLLENSRPDLPRVGWAHTPKAEPVRFCQNPSLEFASSTLESFLQSPEDDVPKLFLKFFGMLGPNAPLPPHLTEYARERKRSFGDPTLTEFLNVFNHRLASFFYRAWSASQKSVDLDRKEKQRFATFVGSFFGLGMDSLKDRDAVPDAAKLYFAGRLSATTRNAEGLEVILREYLQIHAEIHTFVGRYMDLPADSLCRLGQSQETGSLGVNAIMGTQFYECQLNFRIRFGPLSLKDYERLLPGGDSFERVKYWVLNYCGEHFFWDLQLVLKAGEIPPTQLGGGSRLGWTTWISTMPFSRDAEDAIFTPPLN